MGTGIEGLCAFHAEERHVTDTASVDATLRALLADILGLGEARAAALTADSGLFGELPQGISAHRRSIQQHLQLGALFVEDDELHAAEIAHAAALPDR